MLSEFSRKRFRKLQSVFIIVMAVDYWYMRIIFAGILFMREQMMTSKQHSMQQQ